MVSELLTALSSVKAMSDMLKATLDLHTFNVQPSYCCSLKGQ